MGFDYNGCRFILEAMQSGVVFDSCALLGRQEMHVGRRDLYDLLARYSLARDDATVGTVLEASSGKIYAEPFLGLCGAREIISFDNSEYEGATVTFDLNLRVPEAFECRFDCVIDGGTLEHVFNFPSAIANCMRMTKPGGHFLSIAPCNNFMGHGFYQFSPELFYSLLAEHNGYCVERMFIFESRPGARWFEVADPREIRGRVELRNCYPAYLLVQARRVSVVALDNITPQQSDYLVAWSGDNSGSCGHRPDAAREPAFLERMKCLVRNVRLLMSDRGFRRPFYRKYR